MKPMEEPKEYEFVSHVPPFMDITPATPRQKFSSLAELLNDPWIKGWGENKRFKETEGFKYCYDPIDPYLKGHAQEWRDACLMVEWVDKKTAKRSWWVLGYMSPCPTEEELPRWKKP